MRSLCLDKFPLYVLEIVRAWSWSCVKRDSIALHCIKGDSLQIRRNNDGVIVNSRVARIWTVQKWSHNMTNTKILDF